MLSLNTDDPFNQPALRGFTKKESFPFPVLHASDDVAGIYNLLYRYVFDRHRDLPLPAAFLINDHGHIVKIYQGPVNAEHIAQDFLHIPQSPQERLAKALPFAGVTDATSSSATTLPSDQFSFSVSILNRPRPSSNGAARLSFQRRGPLRRRQCLPEAVQDDRSTRVFRSRAEIYAVSETMPNAWNNLGLLATQEGRTDTAIPFFQQALKLSPNHLIALDNLASAYRQQKRWVEARQVLEHALTVSPQDPEANYSLGMVYAQTNDEQHAYEYLQRALESRPGYPEALNNMGVLKLRTGHRDDAVKIFEECMRVAPDFDQAY